VPGVIEISTMGGDLRGLPGRHRSRPSARARDDVTDVATRSAGERQRGRRDIDRGSESFTLSASACSNGTDLEHRLAQ
jgi:hypothetical protein